MGGERPRRLPGVGGLWGVEGLSAPLGSALLMGGAWGLLGQRDAGRGASGCRQQAGCAAAASPARSTSMLEAGRPRQSWARLLPIPISDPPPAKGAAGPQPGPPLPRRRLWAEASYFALKILELEARNLKTTNPQIKLEAV